MCKQRTARADHVGWQPEGQPERIGVMKLYMHRYSRTKERVAESEEIQVAKRFSGWLASAQKQVALADPGWETPSMTQRRKVLNLDLQHVWENVNIAVLHQPVSEILRLWFSHPLTANLDSCEQQRRESYIFINKCIKLLNSFLYSPTAIFSVMTCHPVS